jgi:hypothetical protein
MSLLIALRRSGRFRVIVLTAPASSQASVEYWGACGFFTRVPLGVFDRPN